MGLTENQKHLIKAISKGEIADIKKIAVLCLKEDETQKNSYFCKQYIATLSNQPTFIELPHNIKHLVSAEDMQMFNDKRYFLSDREEKILNHIKRMALVEQKMNEIGIKYINSTLLYGESGTGKTTFAKYVAKALNLPFVYINFSKLIDSYMGKTSSNIAEVFNYVNNNKCVFMLDEIDCISVERSSNSGSGSDGEISRITITLMQEFDKLSSGTVLISATNRLDRIDKALVRRFSKIHEVKPLGTYEMLELANDYMLDIGIDVMENININVKNQAKLVTQINELVALEIEKQLTV